MNVITITRDFGAGGYEVANRLAHALGWELLDRELLHQAAAVEHLPDVELERLDEKAISLADRFRLHPPHQHYFHGLKEAALQAAARGNVVLVGRGTAQLLSDVPNVFHLRLVASKNWRAGRVAQREGWTLEQALARCNEEDRIRARFTRYFFGEAPFQAAPYHLTLNTDRIPLDEVVAHVVALIRNDWTSPAIAVSPIQRVMTLAPELGAGERAFPTILAERLHLHVYDRDLLEQEATRLGVPESELEKIDEQSPGILQRFRPGSLSQRYFEAMEQIMNELAAQGEVLLVGRGGSRFLRDDPRAFHVRLVAPLSIRVRRVMEHRWVRETQARELIAASDAQRCRFYEGHFGASRDDPLEYHITVNSGLLGSPTLDLTAFAAGRYWLGVEARSAGS